MKKDGAGGRFRLFGAEAAAFVDRKEKTWYTVIGKRTEDAPAAFRGKGSAGAAASIFLQGFPVYSYAEAVMTCVSCSLKMKKEWRLPSWPC